MHIFPNVHEYSVKLWLSFNYNLVCKKAVWWSSIFGHTNRFFCGHFHFIYDLWQMPQNGVQEVGYFSFSQAGGALLFYLLSKIDERTRVITTNLTFSEWDSVFGDAKLTAALSYR